MKLYGIADHNPNASAWYRTIMPFRTAHKMKLADVLLDQPSLKMPHEQERRAMAVQFADIVQHYQNYSPGFKLSRDMASRFPTYWESPNSWNTGPSFVYDTDDDLFSVSPLNPAFRDLGTHWAGQVIPKHGSVVIDVPGKGQQVLFKDGVDGFDVEQNFRKQMNLRENMKAADLITCTTMRSADYVARETGRTDMHVYPNCIDFGDWPKVELAQDDTVRVLWQSSSSHFDDIWPLTAALGRIHKKYENVEIILFGSPYKWLCEQLVPERTISIGWTNYDLYIWRLSTLNADITLAPLNKSVFNDSRSGIRMYESAACWKPACTLAENWGPYRDEIIEGETGRLFDTVEEFEQKLGEMIEDRKKTREMAQNAKDWVRTNRDPYKHVPKLIEAYQRLRDIRRAVSTPPPPIEEPKNESVPAVDLDVRGREDADREASVQAEHN